MVMSEAEIRVLTRKLDRVLDILENDEKTDEIGLVKKFSNLEQAFENFVKQYTIDVAVRKGKDIANKAWWGIVGGAIMTALLALGKFILGIFFK